MKATLSIFFAGLLALVFCLAAYTGIMKKQKQPAFSQKTGKEAKGATQDVSGLWLEKDASFRLMIFHGITGKNGYLDLRSLCIPGNPANGVRIYDSAGKIVSAHQYDTLHYLLPASPKKETYTIYYEFPSPRPWMSWDQKKNPVPDNFRLRQYNITRRYPGNPSDVWQIEYRKKNAPYSRSRRDFWNALGAFQTAQADFLTALLTALPDLRKVQETSCLDYHYAESMLKFRGESLRKNSEDFLEETFFSNFRNRQWGENATQIFFTRRPFDTDRNLLTCFKGYFTVEADGVYEFRMNTNSTRILRVNGKTVYRKFGQFQAEKANSYGTTDYLTLSLEKGSNYIEYLYYKESMATWASLSWRKKGDVKFKLMTEDDFAPAFPVQPLRVENQKKEKFPLVFRNDSLALFTAKHNPYSLDRFQVLNGDQFRWHWELDGRKIHSDIAFFALENELVNELKIVPEMKSGYSPFSLKRYARAGVKAPVRPDLSLKIWSPYFLYDDEYCNLTLEINSALPMDSILQLTAKVSKENSYLKPFSERIRMSAMPMEHEDRFARSQVQKQSFHLEGRGMRNESVLADYEIELPGLRLDRCGIAVIPLSQMPEELFTSEYGLCDSSGRKILPILHRMTLHEVRSWELLRTLKSEFQQVRRLLVISENFPGWKKELTDALKKQSVELEFIEWSSSVNPSGSAALETIPRILTQLKNSTADAALIIPLAANRHGTIGMREEMNCIGMIAELLLNKKNIQKLFLSTPFPLAPGEDGVFSETQLHLNEELRKLRREKGMYMIELDALLRKNTDWNDEAYRLNGEKKQLPVGLISSSVKILASEIERK